MSVLQVTLKCYLDSSEISPTRCNNCVLFFAMALLCHEYSRCSSVLTTRKMSTLPKLVRLVDQLFKSAQSLDVNVARRLMLIPSSHISASPLIWNHSFLLSVESSLPMMSPVARTAAVVNYNSEHFNNCENICSFKNNHLLQT